MKHFQIQATYLLVLAATSAATLAAPDGSVTADAADVAFVSIRSGDAQVYTRDSQGVERIVSPGKGIHTQPAWSSTGKLAYSSRVGAVSHIHVVNEDGSGQKRLTEDDRFESAPSWSPDGKSVAFYSMSQTTGMMELRIVDLQTGNTVTVTGDSKSKGPAAPTWSANGERLTFLGTDEEGRRSQVWVVQRDGSGLRDVSSKFTSRGGVWASLSPDGQQIAWVADMRGRLPIIVTQLDTGESKDMTADSTAGHESPRWSPDGRQIVFASTRDDPMTARNDIFVMNADGSNVRNLSRHPQEDFDPKWAADGKSVVFASLRSGTSLLYEVDLASGNTQALSQHASHDMDHVVRPVAMLR